MKKSIFIVAFFSLFLLTSCGDNSIEKPIEYERTTWVNSNVECCGVKDPINNLEWILQTPRVKDYETASFSFSNYILLFNNDSTQENFIIFNIIDYTNYYIMNYIIIYDCNGNIIDGGKYHYENSKKINYIENDFYSDEKSSAEPCRMCDKFFETHTLVDTIAYFVIKPKN